MLSVTEVAASIELEASEGVKLRLREGVCVSG